MQSALAHRVAFFVGLVGDYSRNRQRPHSLSIAATFVQRNIAVDSSRGSSARCLQKISFFREIPPEDNVSRWTPGCFQRRRASASSRYTNAL